jgi:hypothetical protein
MEVSPIRSPFLGSHLSTYASLGDQIGGQFLRMVVEVIFGCPIGEREHIRIVPVSEDPHLSAGHHRR